MAEAAKDGAKPKAGGGGIVGRLVVTLLAAAGGGGFGMFIYKTFIAEAQKKAPEEHATEEEPAIPGMAKLVALTPLVANLAEPTNAWVRIEASVLINGMKDGAEDLAAKVGEDLVAYLRTTTLAQLEGPTGFQNIREDLLDRAKIRDGEHVKDVIIHGIVLE